MARLVTLADTPQINLGGKLLQGLQAGQAISNIREQKLAKEQATALKKQYALDLQNAFSDGSPKAIAQLIAKYPQQREAFKQSFDLLNEEQKQAEIGVTTQVYSALQSGNTEVAKTILDRQITALKNDNKDASNLERIRESIDINPKGVANFAGLTLASLMGKEQFAKVSESLGKERRATEEQPLNIKKLEADINKVIADQGLTKANTKKALVEAKKNEALIRKTNAETQGVILDTSKKVLELNQARSGDIKLTKDGEKLLNDSILSATNSNSLANQYANIAKNIEEAINLDASTGVAGKASEAVKKVWGSQDRITRLRQEFTRLKNSAVLNMLPPGPATDKDIEIAQRAFPDENADPQFIASFMRGLSKLQKYDAQLNEAKADWVNNVGNLGRAKKDISVEGQEVAKGTSFNEFVTEFIKTPNITEEDQQQPMPTPQPTPTNVITVDQAQSLGITFQ